MDPENTQTTDSPVEEIPVESQPTADSVTPEVTETPVEVAPVEEAPLEQPALNEDTPVVDDGSDIAPEEIPVIHNDDGSVGRELEHVVTQ